MRQSVVKIGLSDFIFQRDNDQQHTSSVAEVYFKQYGIKRQIWPSQLPDMSLIEITWAIFKQGVSAKMPKNLKELDEV